MRRNWPTWRPNTDADTLAEVKAKLLMDKLRDRIAWHIKTF